jgi:hypothetical protein
VGCTESLLPHADMLLTISSNVALAAAILGKEVGLLGRCKLSALATRAGERPASRTDLIPFVVESYCRPASEWVGRDGAFFHHLRTMVDEPESLLEPPAPSASLAPFLSR